MRDAFGGAFSIKLMLIFLILYVSFICVAINYARAFRVKNRIINIVEQNEGYNINKKGNLDSQISGYLNNSGYYIEYNDLYYKGENISSCEEYENSYFEKPGYCIVKLNDNPEYYRVETYMVFTLPIINVHFPIAVRGETRRIEIPD